MLLILCVIWAGDPSARSSRPRGGSTYGNTYGNTYGSATDGTADGAAEEPHAGPVAADAASIEASAEKITRNDPVNVDTMSAGPPIPGAEAFPDDPDALVDAIYASSEVMGEELQDAAAKKFGIPSTGSLAEVAQRVEEGVAAAASPAPPQFEPLSLDVLPQKYWEPVYPGCAPVFTEKRCDYFYPTPRLWITDLDQLQYARSLEQGRENMIEPVKARQALAQLLSIGVRTRRDVYTQASPANDIASQSKCAQLETHTPAYVWL